MSEYTAVMDGNEAAAHVAYRASEVIAIYPITPASPMGELSDLWSSRDMKNVWGTTPRIIEMQAEGGAAGAVHGALQAGSLTTTFTASQGLLLMIPNMYKISGELTGAVFHIAARSIASQALSIFGDHSDVMAARATGWGMLFASSVQEAMDMAVIAHSVSLSSRIPFLHIFDGFRTSHELKKITVVPDSVIHAMLPEEHIQAHRARGMNPERPVIRGTAQNPDVFFQTRESVNPRYDACLETVTAAMEQFGALTGRNYQPFEYTGHPEAERVVVLMGSGVDTAREAIGRLVDQDERVGVLNVRLFRPFSSVMMLRALPVTVRSIAVLDRTKEPGSAGEPLYQDVVTACAEAAMRPSDPDHPISMPAVIGGRYGLSSKEFTPAMVLSVLDELRKESPRRSFTVGIDDDVTHRSLTIDPRFTTEHPETRRAVFWGLGSDGTVGANKNTIKIIGEYTPYHAQGYFVYDSKKAGARTVSHLRFGPEPIQSAYLIREADFVAVHQFNFLADVDILSIAAHGATLLINSPHAGNATWSELPREVQKQILDKELRVFVIDAYALARKLRLGVRINTIMQTAFFMLSDILPTEEAISHVRDYIRSTYGKRGEPVVRQNMAAVDAALDSVHELDVPAETASTVAMRAPVPPDAPEFVRRVTAEMIAGRGDALPVSAFPDDGTWPSGTTKYEKRNIALEVPVWEEDLCIQCGKCVMVCPHSVIRANVVPEAALADAPDGYKSLPASWRGMDASRYTLEVSTMDCTGCQLCVEVCPARDKSNASRKALNMAPNRDMSTNAWNFFSSLPPFGRTNGQNGDGAMTLPFTKVKDVQLLEPLFEFSSACAGCGETPYIRLLTQLYGDHIIVANATGCSSIYGGNLPTTPWTHNAAGRGPAWNNSLFEDNAEFGLGMRLSLDKQNEYARELVERLRGTLGDDLATALIDSPETDDALRTQQRARINELRARLEGVDDPMARDLLAVSRALARHSVWIVGGDGWAYDIGFGGLDHVLASGRNVNVIVLDTEVYSNTGGQASKATSLGAVAKFAAGGKPTPKKDLGMMAVGYGYVYVAQVAMGANDNQVIKALQEAESYDGPSLVIAYSPCIAHGIDMSKALDQQTLAVQSGYWPLYRYDPRRAEEGKTPLQLDCKPPNLPLGEYIHTENRYRMLLATNPGAANAFLEEAQKQIHARWKRLEGMAHGKEPDKSAGPASPPRARKLPPTPSH